MKTYPLDNGDTLRDDLLDIMALLLETKELTIQLLTQKLKQQDRIIRELKALKPDNN